jgi:hypothetical protein
MAHSFIRFRHVLTCTRLGWIKLLLNLPCSSLIILLHIYMEFLPTPTPFPLFTYHPLIYPSSRVFTLIYWSLLSIPFDLLFTSSGYSLWSIVHSFPSIYYLPLSRWRSFYFYTLIVLENNSPIVYPPYVGYTTNKNICLHQIHNKNIPTSMRLFHAWQSCDLSSGNHVQCLHVASERGGESSVLGKVHVCEFFMAY